MAEINYSDLLMWLKQHPDYKSQQLGVDAETSLYIRFSTPKKTPVDSESMILGDGSQLVIDREQDGTIVGLEIT